MPRGAGGKWAPGGGADRAGEWWRARWRDRARAASSRLLIPKKRGIVRLTLRRGGAARAHAAAHVRKGRHGAGRDIAAPRSAKKAWMASGATSSPSPDAAQPGSEAACPAPACCSGCAPRACPSSPAPRMRRTGFEAHRLVRAAGRARCSGVCRRGGRKRCASSRYARDGADRRRRVSCRPAQLGPKGREARGVRRSAALGTYRQSIGIDLPTMNNKDERDDRRGADRQVSCRCRFERTAVNGFGFIQIIRKRERANADRAAARRSGAETAALALLRLAERAQGTGPAGGGAVTLNANPAVIERIRRAPDWTARLEKRRGGTIAFHADSALGTGEYHAG
jgi:hypothetical protein